MSIRAADEARGPQANGMSMELLSVLKIQGSPINQDLTRDALQQFISNKTWFCCCLNVISYINIIKYICLSFVMFISLMDCCNRL